MHRTESNRIGTRQARRRGAVQVAAAPTAIIYARRAEHLHASLHAIADRAKPRHIAHGKKLPVRTGAVNGAGWSGLKPRDLASAVRVAVLVDAEGVQVREPEVGQGCAAVAVDVLALPETSGATAGDDDG